MLCVSTSSASASISILISRASPRLRLRQRSTSAAAVSATTGASCMTVLRPNNGASVRRWLAHCSPSTAASPLRRRADRMRRLEYALAVCVWGLNQHLANGRGITQHSDARKREAADDDRLLEVFLGPTFDRIGNDRVEERDWPKLPHPRRRPRRPKSRKIGAHRVPSPSSRSTKNARSLDEVQRQRGRQVVSRRAGAPFGRSSSLDVSPVIDRAVPDPGA